jgi:hypothetical protein
MGIFIDTTERQNKLDKRRIAKKVEAIFDMRPYFRATIKTKKPNL